jgi:hypothetical protein
VHESLIEFVGFLYLCCGPYCGSMSFLLLFVAQFPVKNHFTESFAEILNIAITCLLSEEVGVFSEISHKLQLGMPFPRCGFLICSILRRGYCRCHKNS